MKDVLTYKGFIGTVHFSAEDKVFHGKIEGIDDLVTFEGHSVEELIKAFHNEVDDYIALCKEMGKEPIRSYKGSFNVRISPEMHRKAVERAT
ncbi:MAG TPA: type II toxin-antitoxin system HicB family antitoxin, partial [Candidatus Brocadiaceae bacterium]|nr:type II toxin-antitoxin system HicB family antitoxin [Candidatus Brocadiaceae bacterium]